MLQWGFFVVVFLVWIFVVVAVVVVLFVCLFVLLGFFGGLQDFLLAGMMQSKINTVTGTVAEGHGKLIFKEDNGSQLLGIISIFRMDCQLCQTSTLATLSTKLLYKSE